MGDGWRGEQKVSALLAIWGQKWAGLGFVNELVPARGYTIRMSDTAGTGAGSGISAASWVSI